MQLKDLLRHKQIDKQTDKQTDRQKDRQTDVQGQMLSCFETKIKNILKALKMGVFLI